MGVDEGGREGVHVNVFNICVHFVFKASSFCLALTSSNERCLRYSKASTQLFCPQAEYEGTCRGQGGLTLCLSVCHESLEIVSSIVSVLEGFHCTPT